MKRKIIILISSIVLLLLVISGFHAQTNAQQTVTSPTNTDNSNMKNSTLNLIPAALGLQSHQDFTNFLNYVAGINMDKYNQSSFYMSSSKVMGSQNNQTTISAIVSNNQVNLSVAMILIDGKVRFYDLGILSGALEGKGLGFADSLTSAKIAIDNYASFFNASYCRGFDELVPENIPIRNLTVNSYIDNKELNIQTTIDSASKLENTRLCWYQTTNGMTIAARSIQVTVSNNGVMTTFADNLGLYKIAATAGVISKQQAIDISMPHVNTYIKENDREIKSVNATFGYVTDLTGSRGDSFLVYPQWSIDATFGDSNNDVYGYSTLIWADNGEVRYEGPQANFRPISTNSTVTNSTISLVVTSIAIIAIMPFAVGFVYIRRQGENRRWKNKDIFKIGGIFMTLAILTSPILIQPASANTSGVFGSTNGVDQTEINLDNSLTANITNWSSQYLGLTSLNYYGANTVASNLYYGARNFGDTYSLVFYIGHGDYQGGSYSIKDNSGYDVTDSQIYSNSYYASGNKFAVIWSCEQGDEISGMPHAWLHTNDLSSDAYNSPDSSGQEFIGWNGGAPFLKNEFTCPNTGYWFLYYFYWYTLTQYFTSNAALDIASFQVFGTSYVGGYDESTFYSGTGSGNMVTYGDGNIYPTGVSPPASAWIYFYTVSDYGDQLPVNCYVDNGDWVIPAGYAGQITPGEHTISFDASCQPNMWQTYYYNGCDWSDDLSFQYYLYPNTGQSLDAYYVSM